MMNKPIIFLVTSFALIVSLLYSSGPSVKDGQQKSRATFTTRTTTTIVTSRRDHQHHVKIHYLKDRDEEDEGVNDTRALAHRRLVQPILEGNVTLDAITNNNLLTGVIQLRKEPPLRALTEMDILNASLHNASCALQHGHEINITLCSPVKNRAKLTLEWLLYHYLLGVSHFVIFDDHSDDNLRATVQPFINLGILDMFNDLNASTGNYTFLSHRAFTGQQHFDGICVTMALERMSREGQIAPPWVGFLDTDEFVYVRDGRCLQDLLLDMKLRRPSLGLVQLRWRMVPPSQGDLIDDHPTQMCRTGFSFGYLKPPLKQAPVYKYLVYSRAIVNIAGIHRAILQKGYSALETTGEERTDDMVLDEEDEHVPAWLLHYHTRSLRSYLQRSLDGHKLFGRDEIRVNISGTVTQWLGFATAVNNATSQQGPAQLFFGQALQRYLLIERLLGGECTPPNAA